MASASYQTRRDEIETYFDRTAADAWAALTSDAPVSRIRRTVRRGRDAMRQTLMSWLPEDMTGSTLIDAGCGTGTLAIEAAQRGAEVVAVDLSPTLVNLARERLRDLNQTLDVTFLVGDMRDMDLGSFDYAVAMDSLIHYDVADGVADAGGHGGADSSQDGLHICAENTAAGVNARRRKVFPPSRSGAVDRTSVAGTPLAASG